MNPRLLGVDTHLPFNRRVILINEVFGEGEELLLGADVLGPPCVLRREHDGAHADVLCAPRFLEAKREGGADRVRLHPGLAGVGLQARTWSSG